jgi:ribosomal protein L10
MLVGARGQVGIVVVANGVDRAEADRLRKEGRAEGEAVVVSRNADGTYRVTRGH